MAQRFVKINVEKALPTEDGKYIVFTKTKMGNGNIFECRYHNKNGKPHWGCTNQIVTHWLNSYTR